MKMTSLLACLLVLCVGGVARADRVEVHKWQIELSGEVLHSQGRSYIRACAGGIDDHTASDFQYRAHTRQVMLRILDDQQPAQPLANAAVELRFVGNTGHDYGSDTAKKTAQLHLQSEPFDGAHPWLQVLAGVTDSDGRLGIWVKSGDLICQPKLQINRVLSDGSKNKIGEVECDFAESVSLRRFINPYDPEELFPDEDTGWLFDFPRLDTPNKTTPSKIYLKFMVDPLKGNVVGNWRFVNGHEIYMKIGGVEIEDDEGNTQEVSGTPQELKRYVFVIDQPNGPTSPEELTALRTTANDGATPQAYVQAGMEIEKISVAWVDAEDRTQRDN